MSWVKPAGQADHLQATLIMVLPETLLMGAMPKAQKHTLSYKLGVGFARLACQVIAWYLDMQSIWLLDDNVHGCWVLDLNKLDFSEQNGPTVRHPGLMPISVADMMLMIQQQVGSWQALRLTGVLFDVGLVQFV